MPPFAVPAGVTGLGDGPKSSEGRGDYPCIGDMGRLLSAVTGSVTMQWRSIVATHGQTGRAMAAGQIILHAIQFP